MQNLFMPLFEYILACARKTNIQFFAQQAKTAG